MRKPLAVVLGVTAAVLIAGGIAATTAGADTTPGGSAVPALDLPGMPELPQLPAGDAPAEPDQAAGPDQARPDQAGSDQAGSDQAGPDQAGPDQAGPDQAGPDQAATGDQGHAGNQRDQNQTGGQTLPDGPGNRPANDRPGGQRAPADQGGAARPGGQGGADKTSLIAAAQRDVSPSSVSTSPSAPVQQQVLALVNENRRRGGCGDLTLDRRLITAAYDHAYDMARRGYFGHESPNGDGSGDRMREAGYRWSRYGENIARGQENAYEVVDGWMHSPVHRENIMDCRLRQMGIGLAFAPDRTPYWVQDFATPQ